MVQTDLKKEVARLTQQNGDLKRNYGEVKRQYRELNAEIARLKGEVESRNALIEDLKVCSIPEDRGANLDSKSKLQVQQEQNRRFGLPEKPVQALSDTALGKRKEGPSTDPRPPKRPQLSDVGDPPKVVSEPPSHPVPSASSSIGEKADLPQVQSRTVPKDNVIRLTPSEVEVYLREAPKYHISPQPLASSVSRQAMHLAYGITPRPWLETIPRDKNPSGNRPRHIWFVDCLDHPNVPNAPGESGLVFGLDTRERNPTTNGPWSVFGRPNGKLWTYFGEYDNTKVSSLTKEQFCAQTFAVRILSRGRRRGPAHPLVIHQAKKQWVKTEKLILDRMPNAYRRARLALLKEGVHDMQRLATMTAERVADKERGVVPDISEEDVLDAYKRGYERVSVIRMRCVGYDHAFIRHVETACSKVTQESQAKTPSFGASGKGSSKARSASSLPSKTKKPSIPRPKAFNGSVPSLPPRPQLAPFQPVLDPSNVIDQMTWQFVNAPHSFPVSPLMPQVVPAWIANGPPMFPVSQFPPSLNAPLSMPLLNFSSVPAEQKVTSSNAVPLGKRSSLPKTKSTAARHPVEPKASADPRKQPKTTPFAQCSSVSSSSKKTPGPVPSVKSTAPPSVVTPPAQQSYAEAETLSTSNSSPSSTPNLGKPFSLPPLIPSASSSSSSSTMPPTPSMSAEVLNPPLHGAMSTAESCLSVSSSLRALWDIPPTSKCEEVWDDEDMDDELSDGCELDELEYP
ncbi:hypothetical protein NMY22_g1705 [Coprinellus aureogranulatus]|nr:hypothetical protein NMY22_g1705 [Coprinellus aureogranulatus]